MQAGMDASRLIVRPAGRSREKVMRDAQREMAAGIQISGGGETHMVVVQVVPLQTNNFELVTNSHESLFLIFHGRGCMRLWKILKR